MAVQGATQSNNAAPARDTAPPAKPQTSKEVIDSVRKFQSSMRRTDAARNTIPVRAPSSYPEA